jgi:hypothetical protein
MPVLGRPLPVVEVGYTVDQVGGQLSGGEIARPALPTLKGHAPRDHEADAQSSRISDSSCVTRINPYRISVGFLCRVAFWKDIERGQAIVLK